MCKVRDIDVCDKKVCVYTIDGKRYESDWFSDPERKNVCGEDKFTALERAYYDMIIDSNPIDPGMVIHWTVARKREDPDCVYVSRHAFQRMKERNGWNKKTSIRMAKKIYNNGLNPDEVHGVYRPWVMNRLKKEPSATLKLYGQNLYVFDNQILITTYRAKKYSFA